MTAFGKSIAAIEDIPLAGSVDNVLADKPGITLNEPSRVRLFVSRETVDVEVAITVGGSNVYPRGPAALNAVVGTLPSTQDDLLIDIMAQRNDTIIVEATNKDAAAAREVRVLAFITPVTDAVLSSAMSIRGGIRP